MRRPSDAKLHILRGDGVPVLVDHHDGEEDEEAPQEHPVDVVGGDVAELVGEDEHDGDAGDEEECAKQEIT